jgi:FtsH-binding integral membrane protein
MAYAPDPAATSEPKRGNGFAITAMVLGIIAAVLAFIPVVNIVSFVLAIAAIVFGIVGLIASGKRRTGKGMSIAGIALGVVALAIAILMYVLVFDALEDECEKQGHSRNLQECVEDLDTEDLPTDY